MITIYTEDRQCGVNGGFAVLCSIVRPNERESAAVSQYLHRVSLFQ